MHTLGFDITQGIAIPVVAALLITAIYAGYATHPIGRLQNRVYRMYFFPDKPLSPWRRRIIAIAYIILHPLSAKRAKDRSRQYPWRWRNDGS